MNENKKFEYNVREINSNYDFFIFNASTINNPKNNTIIFLKKNLPELLEKLRNIKESILIILEGMDAEYLKEKNIVIYSKNPRLDYAILLTKILSLNKKETKLHFKNGYYYGENCEFAENIIIEPFVKIGNNVKIGENTIIKAGTIIEDNVKIGKNCYIRENSVIGGEDFGIETDSNGSTIRIPHLGGVIIGNNVEIGTGSTVCSGTIEETIVEDYVKVDYSVNVGHNTKIGRGTIICAGALIGGSSVLGSNVIVGMNASIKSKMLIGNNAIIGMGAIVCTYVNDEETFTNEMADKLENIKIIRKLKQKILKREKNE